MFNIKAFRNEEMAMEASHFSGKVVVRCFSMKTTDTTPTEEMIAKCLIGPQERDVLLSCSKWTTSKQQGLNVERPFSN